MPERFTRLPNAGRGQQGPESGTPGPAPSDPADPADAAEDGAPRRTRVTTKGHRTRAQLIDAARRVFERDGFLHARITDICEAAGTSNGTFYTYFPSKEQIFKAVVDSVEFDMLTMDAAPRDADPVARIRMANRHYLVSYRDNIKIITVINQVATFDPDVSETRAERQTAFAQAIERRIRALRDAGLADRRVDPAYAANALGGMVASFAEYIFTQKTDFDLETSVEQLTLLWTNALGMPAP